MTSHGSVAARVRADKEKRPAAYCTNARCLWRVQTIHGRKPCPTHMRDEIIAALTEVAEDNSLADLLRASIAAGATS